MHKADVLYSEVKFTRATEKASGTTSSSAEATYSEVNILKTQPAELPGSQQPAESNGRSKVTSERVAVLVLSFLFAAAVVAFVVTFYKNNETMERLQKLKDEYEAVKRNLTDITKRRGEINTVQPVCPKLPEVKQNEMCLKCEEDWRQHGGHCYYFSPRKLSWEESRSECRRLGGDLVKIDSREEQTFLEETVRNKMTHDEDKFWIGLTDSGVEGQWKWVDGSPLKKSLVFWLPKEPDNWEVEDPEGEDCARMGEKSGAHDLKSWVDKSCKIPHRSICEKQAEPGHYTTMCVKSSQA